jgi:hypothetical protein
LGELKTRAQVCSARSSRVKSTVAQVRRRAKEVRSYLLALLLRLRRTFVADPAAYIIALVISCGALWSVWEIFAEVEGGWIAGGSVRVVHVTRWERDLAILHVKLREAGPGQLMASLELRLSGPHQRLRVWIAPYPSPGPKGGPKGFLSSVYWSDELVRDEAGSVWRTKEDVALPLTGLETWFRYPFETYYGLWTIGVAADNDLVIRPHLVLELPATYRVQELPTLTAVPETYRRPSWIRYLRFLLMSDIDRTRTRCDFPAAATAVHARSNPHFDVDLRRSTLHALATE